jgi:predicted SAM-dependent methyltransferase
MKIDIGGGVLSPAGYINMDPVHGVGEWKRRAQDGLWPVGSEPAEAVRASHVMEHIPAGAERIFVMNEAYRVLITGGTFEIEVPILRTMEGFVSWEAIADPTHVSYWCHESFLYFVRNTAYAAHADYGLSYWDMGSYEEIGNIARVELIKP